MNQYIEQYFNFSMGNIAVGREQLNIAQRHWIPKIQRKSADTVDENHATDIIDGCDFVDRL